MTLHLSKQILATRINRIQRYVKLTMTLAFLSEVVGFTSLQEVIKGMLIIALWSGYYVLLIRSLNKILYSFLTFLAVGIVFNTIFIFFELSSLNYAQSILHAINLLVFLIIVFNMNRPIFYPKINWTEYDFRHRKDKRVKIKVTDGEDINARIYDTRRGEASLLCFEELELDDEYEVFNMDNEHFAKARVLSQRKALLGRPIAHGVKLL